jgi:hypothetical protein
VAVASADFLVIETPSGVAPHGILPAVMRCLSPGAGLGRGHPGARFRSPDLRTAPRPWSSTPTGCACRTVRLPVRRVDFSQPRAAPARPGEASATGRCSGRLNMEHYIAERGILHPCQCALSETRRATAEWGDCLSDFCASSVTTIATGSTLLQDRAGSGQGVSGVPPKSSECITLGRTLLRAKSEMTRAPAVARRAWLKLAGAPRSRA